MAWVTSKKRQLLTASSKKTIDIATFTFTDIASEIIGFG